tara:strand:- start:1395 stop:1637 length:243 start_codon:yes stop_codon:yes gene_type:complete
MRIQDYKPTSKGLRFRLAACNETGAIGMVTDKMYSGLIEILFERDFYQNEHLLDFPEHAEHAAEWPNKAYRQQDTLTLID